MTTLKELNIEGAEVTLISNFYKEKSARGCFENIEFEIVTGGPYFRLMKRILPADERGIVTDALLELTVNKTFRYCWTSDRFKINEDQKTTLKAVLLKVNEVFSEYKGKHFE